MDPMTDVHAHAVWPVDEPEPDWLAVEAALEVLRDALVSAFATEGWPRRLVLPGPETAAERLALDGFIAALRLDLPELVVVVRGGS